jgi:hypothetical protein
VLILFKIKIMKTIRAYLGSIQFITIMTLLICFCASCKQKDDIAGGLHDPIMETECCEELILYSGGIPFGDPGSYDDNFSDQDPPDLPDYRSNPKGAPPNPNPVLRLNYDEVPDSNKSYLVQNFDWQAAGFGPITGAILEFEARPEGGQDFNDNIQVYRWHFADNSNTSHAIAGANLGTDGGNFIGLLNNAWNRTNYPEGKDFTIDLANFPSDKYAGIHGGQSISSHFSQLSGVPYFEPANPGDYQLAGGYDLTRMMNVLGFIDFVIANNTMVDWMKLTLTSCKTE